MTALAARVRKFSALLTQRRGADLGAWITTVRADDLHAFTHGLEKDRDAVVAGLTLPCSNGPAEGVNTKVKYLKRSQLLLATQANTAQPIAPTLTSRIPDPS